MVSGHGTLNIGCFKQLALKRAVFSCIYKLNCTLISGHFGSTNHPDSYHSPNHQVHSEVELTIVSLDSSGLWNQNHLKNLAFNVLSPFHQHETLHHSSHHSNTLLKLKSHDRPSICSPTAQLMHAHP